MVTSLPAPGVLSGEQRGEEATLPGIPAEPNSHRVSEQQSPCPGYPAAPPLHNLSTPPPHMLWLFLPILSEMQLVSLPPLRRLLTLEEDGGCLATAGHSRNVMSISPHPWTMQSPRPSSEGQTFLAPEGLPSQ